MDEEKFLSLLKSSNIISGKFNFLDKKDYLMDLDVFHKQFSNCEIRGGDFASSTFKNCKFDKVIFRKTALIGVSFLNCHFIDCRLFSAEASFSMNDCKIDKFNVTRLDV